MKKVSSAVEFLASLLDMHYPSLSLSGLKNLLAYVWLLSGLKHSYVTFCVCFFGTSLYHVSFQYFSSFAKRASHNINDINIGKWGMSKL